MHNELSTVEVPDLYQEYVNCVWYNSEVETIKYLLTYRDNMVRFKFKQNLRNKITRILSTTRLQNSTRQQIIDNLIKVLKDTDILDTLRMGILSASINRSLKKELFINIYINTEAKLIKRLYKE